MEIKLVKPNPDMEGAYRDFAAEWERHGEAIIPHAARLLTRDYGQWLRDTAAYESVAPDGYVPMSTFFLIGSEGEIIGAVNIRHWLNDHLLNHSGHIGYGVRPSRRRRGYASAMLAMALPIAKVLGIDRALITCDKHNTGSARTIINNCGVLENEVDEGDRIIQRYWIDLSGL